MKRQLHILFLCFLANLAFAQNDTIGIKTIEFNPEFAYKILEQNQDLRKVNILLNERKNGNIKNNSLTIGTAFLSIMDYQKSNTDSKFAYLMRHPTASNEIGKEVSEIAIHSFQLAVTGTVNKWLSAHAEILYNPEQSFGSGTITDLNRNQLQLRKGFAVIGNLNTCPLYAAIGKMDAPFGQTGSVSPFSNTTMWHAFGGLGYGAQIGYNKSNLHAKFMAVQGGAQFRAMNAPVRGTSVPSRVNNFVGDLNYRFNILENTNLLLGASYLHSSAYVQDFPVTHFASGDENNPAYTYYGKLTINNRLVIKGGFAETLEVWKGTHNPTPPLDVFAASKVSSLDLGAKYDLNQNDDLKYTISGEFSNFVAGADGSPWERQNQIVLGLSALIKKSSKLFVEVFRTEGYAPLNFISGSADNAPFPPGVTHSLSSANSFGVVAGVLITL